VYGWLKEAESRIEQVENEVANLRLERDILKKAIRLFSQDWR
jgi:hypothetical protein